MLMSVDSPIAYFFRSLPLYQLRILLVGLTLAMVLYLIDRERRLGRLTRLLVDERVLNAALSNRLKEVSLLSEVGKAINDLIDLDDVLSMILDSALDLLEADEGSVMLLDETGDTLRVACLRSSRPELVKDALVKVGKAVAGWVAEHREPLLISGAAKPDFFIDLERKERPLSSSMSVPLMSKSDLLGVLNISDVDGNRDFSEYDLRAFGLFAEHAAIAIRNARAYETERLAFFRLEEANRLKTEFVALLSHELRTPLTAIIGSVRALKGKQSQPADESSLDFIDILERQSQKLLRLIEDILAAARAEATPELRRVSFDLAELARQAVDALLGTGTTSPVMVDAPGPAMAFGDPGAMEQVITNLLDNAIKYSPVGAPLRVRVWDEPGSVAVKVADEGKGIPINEVKAIFEPFRQVEPTERRATGGVGLGLYIVRNLVESMGGEVKVESVEGKGSTFTVMLPKRASD